MRVVIFLLLLASGTLAMVDRAFLCNYRKVVSYHDPARNPEHGEVSTWAGYLWLAVGWEAGDHGKSKADRAVNPADAWLVREWRYQPGLPTDAEVTSGDEVVFQRFGFLYCKSDYDPMILHWARIPEWFIARAAFFLAIFAGRPLPRRYRDRRRRAKGLCIACGYDLRGSPTTCPECGARRESEPIAS